MSRYVSAPLQLATHPRWLPLDVSSLLDDSADSTHQLAQRISVRVMKFELSSLRITAPGTVSKNAGHPHPDALMSAEFRQMSPLSSTDEAVPEGHGAV